MIYPSANFNKINVSLQNYWAEANINTPTKTKSKKGHNSAKMLRMITISNLTCILQYYILLQTFNKINASLQKLLIGNQYQHSNKN